MSLNVVTRSLGMIYLILLVPKDPKPLFLVLYENMGRLVAFALHGLCPSIYPT